MTSVAIVIVNWNSKKDTLECLNSLKNLIIPDGVKVVTFVVDNASMDGTVEAIKNVFTQVRLIQNENNLGFAGGNNVGITAALKTGADFIWLLNNDTTVDKNSLKNLSILVKNSEKAIIGTKIYFAKGYEFHKDRYKQSELGRVLWYAGGKIDWKNIYASHRGVDEVDRGQYDHPEETLFVTGCSMLVSKEVFSELGMLDERYYMYLEDVDFCLRAKARGFKLWYQPSAAIWHKNAGSTAMPGNPLQQYYLTRNRFLFGMTYAPLRAKIALLRESLRLFISGAPIQKRAISDALLGRFGGRFVWKS